jgi:hypothetical protein
LAGKKEEKFGEMLLRLRSFRGQQRVSVEAQETLGNLFAQISGVLGNVQISQLVISDSGAKVSLGSHAPSTPIGGLFK